MTSADLLYKIKRPWHFFKTGLLGGFLAQLWYGFPARKLKIVAITGTDGKTTSCFLVYHLLQAAGYKVALITTVAAYIGQEKISTGFHVTAPHPGQLAALMKKISQQGYDYLVLETTSHGIYQYRTWGIKPLVAGLTNITWEHLDYHVNYENYVKAKAEILQRAGTAIINRSDRSYSLLSKILRTHRHLKVYSLPIKVPPQLKQAILFRFPEDYNQMNALLALEIVNALGVDFKDLAPAMAAFPPVPGRMEFIPTHSNFQVVVDFAHTPNALEHVLTNLRTRLRKNGGGRLIAVFGSAGLRDKKKRPLMGEVATRLADLSVLTAEDPRTEDVWSIIRQLKEHPDFDQSKAVSLGDRQAAINFAIKIARRGDLVAILGKGHETSLCIGRVEYPWSDQQAVATALKLLLTS